MSSDPIKNADGSLDWTGVDTIGSIDGPATAGPASSLTQINNPASASAPAVRNNDAGAVPDWSTTPTPVTPVTPVTPAVPAAGPSATAAPSNTLADLSVQYPWLATIGLSPQWFQDTAATSTSDADVVGKLRQTSQYKTRFAGILNDNGSMKMNESQYLTQEANYKQLLQQYGVSPDKMNDPSDFVGFFNSDIDPNELKTRLDTYQQIKDGGQNVQDAFYVYAGMKVGVDDLYSAAVDPAAAQNLADEYNQKVAAQPLDYTTWITRATQAGLNRVSQTLGQLQASGALTGDAVQSVLKVDPNFARSIMDALYHGGDPTSGQTMDLQSLLASFEEASIGSAATGAGLVLPDKARIMELRAAGVTKAAAQSAYSQFSSQQNLYAGSVQRMTDNSRSFTQSDFEQAALLGNGQQSDLLARAQKQEDSYGAAGGQFQFNQNKRNQFTQQGLSANGS